MFLCLFQMLVAHNSKRGSKARKRTAAAGNSTVKKVTTAGGSKIHI